MKQISTLLDGNHQRKQPLVLTVIFLLLAGQWLVTAHSVEHPFHVSDSSCVLYQSVQHHAVDIVVVNLAVVLTLFCIEKILFTNTVNVLFSKTSHHARAPPLHS